MMFACEKWVSLVHQVVMPPVLPAENQDGRGTWRPPPTRRFRRWEPAAARSPDRYRLAAKHDLTETGSRPGGRRLAARPTAARYLGAKNDSIAAVNAAGSSAPQSSRAECIDS